MALRSGDPSRWVGQVWRGAGVGSGHACVASTSNHETRDDAIDAAVKSALFEVNNRRLSMAWQEELPDGGINIVLTIHARPESAGSFY